MYIAEAHPVDGWQMASNEEQNIRIKQAETFEERVEAARLCNEALQLSIPTLVDGMDNAASEAFSAWPERIYILTPHNNVHYPGAPGPFGFDPMAAEEALNHLLRVLDQTLPGSQRN